MSESEKTESTSSGDQLKNCDKHKKVKPVCTHLEDEDLEEMTYINIPLVFVVFVWAASALARILPRKAL